MTIDMNAVATTAMALAASGLGTVVWRTAVLQAKTATQLDAHQKHDDELFALCLAEIREVREAHNGLQRAQARTHAG